MSENEKLQRYIMTPFKFMNLLLLYALHPLLPNKTTVWAHYIITADNEMGLRNIFHVITERQSILFKYCFREHIIIICVVLLLLSWGHDTNE